MACDHDGGPVVDGGGDAGPPAYCGDGKQNQASEQCDDGNTASNDGCSTTCQLEANYVCPNPGQPCVSTVTCGDGVVGGDEQCDDKNTVANDGCSDTCKLEDGFTCPYPGLACVPICGDGKVVGSEECDVGPDVPNDGCDATCRLVDGWTCTGSVCTRTHCGDGKAEGTEQCDDGNFDLGDGCSPFCKSEPDCAAGACVSQCGDGIVLGVEQCDDGNKRDGDGCSHDCKIEYGYYCEQPPLPDQLAIPLVVRDFAGVDPLPAVNAGPPADYADKNHVDFELVDNEPSGDDNAIVRRNQGATATGRGKDLGQPGETADVRHLDGRVIATVSLAGKPVFAKSRAACDKTDLPSSANNWSKCTTTVMDLDSFHTWYVDHDSQGKPVTWPNFLGRGFAKGGVGPTVVKSLTLLHGSFDAAGAFTAGGPSYTFDSRYMLIDGTIQASDGFFPIDELGTEGTSCGGTAHDFHFTSEVRFWFQYDSTTEPQLSFSGDDDVWVYVNGYLALDIGGIHGREQKSFTIDAANATKWGLASGQVYEIAVFQAERNVCASNYWLTLQGFNTSKTECASKCGDGKIASDEVCDDGANNEAKTPPDYGRCSSDCKLRGPHCGDGHVDTPQEECDDGVNLSVYDFNGRGCAPGCVKPPHCGDGKIQAPYEQCDDGTNTSTYGGCNSSCQLAPRCGDRKVQRAEGEECDDGPAGSAVCTPGCKLQVPS
jgi:fibro-slime domain-containing protein